MSKTEIRLSELTPDKHNANKGTERGRQTLENSLRKYGAGRSILVDKHGNIIAGNKTAEEAGQIGLEDVIVVQTDGTKLVAVQRTDLDLEADPQARELAYADNRVGALDLDWDVAQIAADLNNGLDLSEMFTEKEIDKLLGDIEAGGAPEPGIDSAPAQFLVMVELGSEEAQSELLGKLTAEGYSCRALLS